MISKAIQIFLVLAFMAIGFVFVGAFVEYKTLNGANIVAGMIFASLLVMVISVAAFVSIKDFILELN